jgi:hypothetical protein
MTLSRSKFLFSGKTMHKLITLVLTLALVACGGSNEPTLQSYDAAAAVVAEGVIDPTLTAISTPTDLLNFRIRAYVDGLFSINATTAQRAAMISSAAKANGISAELLAKATGYDLADVTYYLGQADPTTLPIRATELAKLKTAITPVKVKNLVAGSTVTFTGAWLSEVNTLNFNGRALAILKRGYSSLEAVLDKSECGSFDAVLYNGQHVAAGYHGIDSKCGGVILSDRTIQMFNGATRLVSGKSLAVQALVKAPTWPTNMVVRVTQGTTITYIPMTPPSMLGTTFAGGLYTGTYTGIIPGALVKTGIAVAVIGNRNWSTGVEFSSPVAVAQIGLPTITAVAFVPLTTTNGLTGVVPSEAFLRRTLIQHLPVADDVRITIKPTEQLGLKMFSNDDWFNSLSLFGAIKSRYNDPPSTIFYGFVQWGGSSIAGIAYIGSTVGIGIDQGSTAESGGWSEIMRHELGHVLGLRHAPCGQVADADPNFPYLNGTMGPVKPFDLFNYVDVATNYDIMGYCGGDWFSDYNYALIQASVELRYGGPQATSLSVKPSLGHMITFVNGRAKVLAVNVAELGGGTHVTVQVDGVATQAVLYELDHGTDVHLWVAGQPGKNYVK